jgi:hypothetical protein
VDTVITIITFSAFLEDCRMSWRLDEECDRISYNGTEMWSDVTARCRVAGGGFIEWLFDLCNNIGCGLALKVGTWSESGVVLYAI